MISGINKIEPDFYANHLWMSSISTAGHYSLTCLMQEWYQKRFQKSKKVSLGLTFYVSVGGGADRDRTDDLMTARLLRGQLTTIGNYLSYRFY